MPVDCVDLLVQESPEDMDTAVDLLPLADGTFIAAGQRDALTDKRGWLGRFEPSGTQRWLVDAASLDPGIDSVVDLAGDESGIWALATGSALANQLVLHFDQDGNAIGTASIQSEAGAAVEVRAIEFTPAGVWLVGRLDYDVWVGLYDPALNTVKDVLIEDHLGYRDAADAVVRDGNGVAVAATVSISPNFDGDVPLVAQTDVVVIWFDQQGIETRRRTVGAFDDPKFARSTLSIRADGAGRWFVGGALNPTQGVVSPQVWVANTDADWTWATAWTVGFGTGFGGIVGVESGLLVAANRTIMKDSSTQIVEGWLGALAAEGSLALNQAHGGRASSARSLADFEARVAVCRPSRSAYDGLFE